MITLLYFWIKAYMLPAVSVSAEDFLFANLRIDTLFMVYNSWKGTDLLLFYETWGVAIITSIIIISAIMIIVCFSLIRQIIHNT